MVCVWYILIPGCFQNHIHKKQALMSQIAISDLRFYFFIQMYLGFSSITAVTCVKALMVR